VSGALVEQWGAVEYKRPPHGVGNPWTASRLR